MSGYATGPSTVEYALPTRVSTSATSVALVKRNPGRSQVTIYNESTAILYVLYGSGIASTTNYTFQLKSGDILIEDHFRGAIQGVWASNDSSAAQVTELS